MSDFRYENDQRFHEMRLMNSLGMIEYHRQPHDNNAYIATKSRLIAYYRCFFYAGSSYQQQLLVVATSSSCVSVFVSHPKRKKSPYCPNYGQTKNSQFQPPLQSEMGDSYKKSETRVEQQLRSVLPESAVNTYKIQLEGSKVDTRVLAALNLDRHSSCSYSRYIKSKYNYQNLKRLIIDP